MTTFLRSHSDATGQQVSSPGFNPSHQERSEASEFASTTKRSSLNNSMTNFFPDARYKKKESHKESYHQQSANETKNNNGEGDSFSFTFYSTKNKSMRDDQPEFGNQGLPTIMKSKEYETSASSSTGFKLDENMIKKGVTLDKVFGGEFKRINIFDNRKSCTNAQDIFPDQEPDFETNREDKYKYESFEILETENEEDVEMGQIQVEKIAPKPKETSLMSKAIQVINRIQHKYKRSKSKSVQRKKPQIPTDSESIINEIIDTSKISKKPVPTEDKMGSRSLSPKFREERANPKQHRMRVSNTRLNNTRSEQDSLEESQLFGHKKNNLSSQTIYSGERRSKILISSTTLGDVRENTVTESNKMAIIKTKRAIIKKSLASLNPSFLAEHENLEGSQNGLPTMPASKSSGLMTMVKFNTNAIPSHAHLNPLNTTKIEEPNNFKKKLVRENKVITEKIKLHEKEKMDRYSKMFKLNNQEKIKLYDGEGERKDSVHRNSTPLNDLPLDKLFERKKLMNF